MLKRNNTFDVFAAGLEEAARETPFRVFLCGPNLSQKKRNPAAALRARIRDLLIQNSIEVVLGEDEGLANPDIKKLGVNVQDCELLYIREHCDAIIIVADSVGSYCELGLFSWHHAHQDGLLNAGHKDFILLIDRTYRRRKSYFNLGPATCVNGGKGLIQFVDFKKYKIDKLLKRLTDQRGLAIAASAGRRRRRGV
jgi:hypothetical protein